MNMNSKQKVFLSTQCLALFLESVVSGSIKRRIPCALMSVLVSCLARPHNNDKFRSNDRS